MVECACGCGQLRPKHDKKGRLREYTKGHNRRGALASLETLRKMSESMKGNKNPIYGKLRPKNICKKISNSLKGRIVSEKTRIKISDAMRGKIKTKETRNKLSKAQKGKKASNETCKKMSKSLKGRLTSSETRKKLSEGQKKFYQNNPLYHVKNNNPCWRGGISFLPYSSEFNKNLKRKILKRDDHICKVCGRLGNSIHHIDYNKKNSDPSNLITLCVPCHMKTNYDRDHWIKYFNSINFKLYPVVSRLNQVDALKGYAFSIEGEPQSRSPPDNVS